MAKTKKKSEQVNCDAEIIETKKAKNEQIVDIYNNIFNYKGVKFSYIISDDEKIYFKGKEIAEFLEYTNQGKSIRDHVSDKYKIELHKLLGGSNLDPPKNNIILKVTERNFIYTKNYLFRNTLPKIFKIGLPILTKEDSN